jgi:Tfp pilus assembly protein PilV
VTLVEIMVVLVIFGIGILALAAVQTGSGQAVYATGHDTRALSVGQARIEAAKAAGFNLAAPDSGQTEIFDWRTDILPVSQGLNRVRVTVSWTERGEPRSMELNTLLSFR